MAAELGIGKVKITGGEPLLREDLVEIVRRIFVIQPVVIVVGGFDAAPEIVRGGGFVEPDFAAIRVFHGDKVKPAFIDEPCYTVDDAVALAEVPDGVQDSFGSLNLIAVDVAVDEHRGFRIGGAGLWIVERDEPEIAAANALTNGLD